MFGYVRPWKAELKIKEFVRYRSVYCGICKTISRNYGQIPRLATTYDLTFLALMLLSMQGKDYGQEMDTCVFHLVHKHPIARMSPALDYSAALAILLSYYKFDDNIIDGEKAVQSRAMRIAFSRARKKAEAEYPLQARIIEDAMQEQRRIEAESIENSSLERASSAFSSMLSKLVEHATIEPSLEEQTMKAFVHFASQLGKWIYAMDALEDWPKDQEKGYWNALLKYPEADRNTIANDFLIESEQEMDLAGQLLPFYRDASILGNIIQIGFPSVRETILRNEKLRQL